MTVEQLRDYCLSLPQVTEDEKWGHLCFCVGEKIFCITDFEDDGGVAFKVEEEDFVQLVENRNFLQAPHFAKKQWVKTEDRNSLSNAEWKGFLLKSYQLVVAKLTRRLRQELGL